MRTRCFVLPTLAACWLASTAFAAPPRKITEIPEFEGLKERWADTMESLGVPGFAVAVVKDGEILVLDAMGPRNVDDNDPIDADTIFYIASITKTYLAAAIVALAEEGRIDLDLPVKTYLPRFKLADEEATSTITVRDLLCHGRGIDSGPIVFLDAYSGQITEDRYYHWLALVEPGGSVEYSNVHYTLLGRVIEAVTGTSWKDYLQERLFERTGLEHTTAYASRMYADANAAIPLVPTDTGWAASPVRKTDRTMHAAGGMGTSARDAARWIQLQLGHGTVDGIEVLSAESVRSMHEFQSKFDEPRGRIRRMEGYGLAWQRGTFRGRPYLTHGGGYIGAAAHVSFLPEHDLGVVVLCNTHGVANGLIDIVTIDIYDRLLGETGHEDLLPRYKERVVMMRQRQKESQPTSANPAFAEEGLSREAGDYIGIYAHPDWGSVEFRLADGALVADLGDLPLTLNTMWTDEFKAHTETGMGFDGVFKINDEGRVIAVQLSVENETVLFER